MVKEERWLPGATNQDRISDPDPDPDRPLLGRAPMAMGYTVAPGECGRCGQLRVQPSSWSGDSAPSWRLMDAPRVEHSLHLDCETENSDSAPTEQGSVKKKKWNTNLCFFGCTPGITGESKPEKERERGRTAAAFGTKLVRGMTFELEVGAWRSAGGRSLP